MNVRYQKTNDVYLPFNMFVSQLSNVTDKESPIFEDCPQNVAVATDESGGHAIPTWGEPKATDNDDSLKVTSNYSGEEFKIGSTVVQYTAIDAAGNSARCVFKVTIIGKSDALAHPGFSPWRGSHCYHSPSSICPPQCVWQTSTSIPPPPLNE